MYHIFCIYSSVEGHLGSFQLLAIINKVAMNRVEHCPSYRLEHLLNICPGEILWDPPVVQCPIFWGTTRLISRVVIQARNPNNNGGVFLFLHILPSICCHLNFFLLFFLLHIFLNYISNAIPEVPHTLPPLPTHSHFLALVFPCTGAYKVCKSNGPLFPVMAD